MEDDPDIKKKYIDNIKRFIHPSGDHITLLIIFYNFKNSNMFNF